MKPAWSGWRGSSTSPPFPLAPPASRPLRGRAEKPSVSSRDQFRFASNGCAEPLTDDWFFGEQLTAPDVSDGSTLVNCDEHKPTFDLARRRLTALRLSGRRLFAASIGLPATSDKAVRAASPGALRESRTTSESASPSSLIIEALVSFLRTVCSLRSQVSFCLPNLKRRL